MLTGDGPSEYQPAADTDVEKMLCFPRPPCPKGLIEAAVASSRHDMRRWKYVRANYESTSASTLLPPAGSMCPSIILATRFAKSPGSSSV